MIFPYEVGDPTPGWQMLITRIDNVVWVALAEAGVIVWRGRLRDLTRSVTA